MVPTYEEATDREESGVDIVSFFVTYTKAAEIEQPTEDPLDDTPMNAQPAAVFHVSLGDERPDARAAKACGFSGRRETIMPQVAIHGKKTEAGYNAAVYFNGVQINNSDFTIRDGTENDLRDLYVRAAESYRMNPSVPAEWSDIFTSEFLEENTQQPT